MKKCVNVLLFSNRWTINFNWGEPEQAPHWSWQHPMSRGMFVCMYVCIYVAAGSVCCLNVPENTPIHVAHVHIDNAHCCTKYWTCWIQRMSTKSSTAIKKRLEKLGQLLTQRFKLACCVDRVGAMYYCLCSYALGSVRPADNAHRREVASAWVTVCTL